MIKTKGKISEYKENKYCIHCGTKGRTITIGFITEKEDVVIKMECNECIKVFYEKYELTEVRKEL